MFRTQSALQDRDQNLTCSEVDAELGAKNIIVELNFHDVKVGNFSIACSPIHVNIALMSAFYKMEM